MGGRDHSIECETCGMYRGGLNDLVCDCNEVQQAYFIVALMHERLTNLATSLRWGAALCRSFFIVGGWKPGCGAAAPASGTAEREKDIP